MLPETSKVLCPDPASMLAANAIRQSDADRGSCCLPAEGLIDEGNRNIRLDRPPVGVGDERANGLLEGGVFARAPEDGACLSPFAQDKQRRYGQPTGMIRLHTRTPKIGIVR